MFNWFTKSDRPAHFLVFFIIGAALFGYFRWNFANYPIPGYMVRMAVETFIVFVLAWGWEKLNEKFWFSHLIGKPQSKFDWLDLLASFIGGVIPVVIGNLIFKSNW
jgi:biotin transporter BioY